MRFLASLYHKNRLEKRFLKIWTVAKNWFPMLNLYIQIKLSFSVIWLFIFWIEVYFTSNWSSRPENQFWENAKWFVTNIFSDSQTFCVEFFGSYFFVTWYPSGVQKPHLPPFLRRNWQIHSRNNSRTNWNCSRYFRCWARYFRWWK